MFATGSGGLPLNSLLVLTPTLNGGVQSEKLKACLSKSSRNKKDLNNVTAAPFSMSFSHRPAAKNTENGASVTSLRSFLFRDNFSQTIDDTH